MSEHIFTIFITTYSTILTGFVGYMAKVIAGHIKSTSNAKRADMLTLRLILIDMHDKYVERGYITRSAFDTFEDVWKLYHDGYQGNTLTDIFHEQVKNLEIKEE